MSTTQAQELHHALEKLPLQGTVAVGLHDPGLTRLPGQELHLDIADETVVLQADRRASPPPLDAAATAYLYVGALGVARLLPVGGSLAIGPVTLGLLLCAAGAILSHRRTVSRGARARLSVFLTASAVAGILTALSGLARAPVTADGVAVMGFGLGLVLLSFVGGFYWTSLGPWRWLVPTTIGANVVLGLLVFPQPSAVTAAVVVSSVLYNTFSFFPCRHLARALERAHANHARSVMAVDVEAERVAFLAGRESVVGLVRQAREDALRQLAMLGTELDTGLARVTALRLQEVEQRLTTIDT